MIFTRSLVASSISQIWKSLNLILIEAMLLLMLFYTTKIYGHIYNQIYDLLPLHPSMSLTQWIPSQRESILSRRSFPKKRNLIDGRTTIRYYSFFWGFFFYSLLWPASKNTCHKHWQNPFVGLLFPHFLTQPFFLPLQGCCCFCLKRAKFEFMLWEGYIHHVINWYTLSQSRLNGSAAMFSQRVR